MKWDFKRPAALACMAQEGPVALVPQAVLAALVPQMKPATPAPQVAQAVTEAGKSQKHQ